MNDLLSNLNLEIEKGNKEANKLQELYQLISTYNYFNTLLLKVKQELEQSDTILDENFPKWDYYNDYDAQLFSNFKQSEILCLRYAKYNSFIDEKDMIFLINDHTLLKIHSYKAWYPEYVGLRDTTYKIIKFKDCKIKIFKDQLLNHFVPIYSKEYYEYFDTLELFDQNNLITPSYIIEKQFESFDGADIRDILIPQSIDEIHEKIKSVKVAKIKILSL